MDVFAEIKRLVDAGEYRDELYGKPGHALAGGGTFLSDRNGEPMQRVYWRGTSEYEEARDAGMIERLPPLRPAPRDAVAEAEQAIGHPLPPLLSRLYLEVGNGGFGPGYGILGLGGGHADDRGHTALDLYRTWTPREGLLPVCSWGCGIYSLLDLSTAEGDMWGFDPNPVPPEQLDRALYRESFDFRTWLERWVRGACYQPVVVEDEQTGEWRGATEAEYEQWQLELEG